MGMHHMAFATRDVRATHRFYSGAMGFELVKVEVTPMGEGGGFAKHLFYSTGSERDQLLAFWDLEGAKLPGEWSADISRGLGLPRGLNHLAFSAESLDDIAKRRERWLAHGHDVMEIDHGWCTSIYTEDPNGIVVEFCVLTKAFTQQDRETALRLLEDPKPPISTASKGRQMYRAKDHRPGVAAG
jgi:catechol 2,3-dioxygenase-like lactoylglutathione lyase family enzyme